MGGGHSPWHKIMSLLRVSPMKNRDDIQVEGKALAGVTCEVLEKYGENSNLK